jgi:hypothetical protein
MRTIESIVRSEVLDFIHKPITVAGGYQFNQYENVKKIHLYSNSQFYGTTNTSAEYPLVDHINEDPDGRIFFNISVPRARAVKRFFDIDVADIRLDEIDPNSEMALQLLNKDFLRFAEKNNLAAELNEMPECLVDYGSMVLKVYKNAKPDLIPLQRYFVDPTVERSKDSRFNIIRHSLTPRQLREKVKDGWDADAIEKIIKDAGKNSKAPDAYEDQKGQNTIMSSIIIDVYERYGYLPKGLLDGSDSEDEVFALTVTAATGDFTKRGKDNADGECLYKQEWKGDLPILDHHLYKTHGRWQGIGIMEMLFPVQQRMNEIANQKRISMEISAIHLFQTADPTVLNNVLTDLENGDIIRTKTPGALQPLVNEERNLPAFDSEIVTYSNQADKLSFANDLIAGGDIPTTMPATNAVIQNNNQVLVHLQSRENFTNFVANEYIKRHVVPQLIKEMDAEHFLRIVPEPEDLLQFDDKIIDIYFFEHVKKELLKGRVIDIFMADDIKAEMRRKLNKKGPNRYAKVLQGYYKERIGDILVLIGNEKKDVAKLANNNFSFMQLLQNPQLLDDPVSRLFITNYGREIGIDTAALELAFAKRESMALEQPRAGAPAPRGAAPMEEEKPDPALAEVL